MIDQTKLLQAKILIVDDLEANVLLLQRILHGAGYTAVESTRDPQAVAGLHRERHFDLILLDLQMPVMDGFEVLEQLAALEKDGYLSVLVVTAQPAHKLRALKAGATDFISKPFDLAEVLTRVHNLLEVRLYAAALRRTLQELQASHALVQGQKAELARLFEQVLAERKLSERLALHAEPTSIARRLEARRDVTADQFADATVLVADVVGFAALPPGLAPAALLEEVFALFDELCDARGVKKVKTLGNSYLAVAGVPVPEGDHAERAAHLALDFTEGLQRINERRSCKLQVRVGLDSGPVTAGVIGRRLFLYDVWGDAVSTASRMESHGVAGRVQVAEGTRRLLGAPFVVEERGTLEIEGKGAVKTWFLSGRGG